MIQAVQQDYRMMGAALVFNIMSPARERRQRPAVSASCQSNRSSPASIRSTSRDMFFNAEYDVPWCGSKPLEGQIADIQSRAEGQYGG